MLIHHDAQNKASIVSSTTLTLKHPSKNLYELYPIGLGNLCPFKVIAHGAVMAKGVRAPKGVRATS